MVDVARFFMEFCKDESCGKCIPCRVGTAQMHRILVRLIGGAAGPEDLKRLEVLCDMVQHTSLCGLGQTAPNPTLSTLRYFRPEYEALLNPRGRLARLELPVVTAPAGSVASPHSAADGREPATATVSAPSGGKAK
jgi:bidirectional [NiFe] hydrogenase diaphorase subunit